MENNRKRKTKFIIIAIILLVIAIIFVIIKLNNSPDKEEKKLISYIEENDYDDIKLKRVTCEDCIYIDFSIQNTNNLFKEALNVKKRIETYMNDEDLFKEKVDIYFSYDGETAIHFANHSFFDNLSTSEPKYHSNNSELGYALITCPLCNNSDISLIKECDNIKILHYIEPSSKNELSIINQMKALEYVRILIDNNSWNKKEIKEEIQESHPGCIVVVQ